MSGRLWAGALPFLIWGSVASNSYDKAPAPTRYRIDSRLEQIVDLSAMGQGNQTTSFGQLAIISVTLSDTAGGQIMHVVIDSLSSDAPIPPETIQKARGVWLHGLIDAWGRGKITATSADSNDMVSQLKGTMARFFPIVKPGAKPGDSWTDTTRVDTKTPAQTMKSVTITRFTHAGVATHAGQAASRIDATSTTTGAGTMENPMAGTMDVELTNAGTSSYFVGPDGRFLGGESKSEGKSLVRTPMAPDPIPVSVKQTTTVSVVK